MYWLVYTVLQWTSGYMCLFELCFSVYICPRKRLQNQESESCSVVCDSLRPHGLYSPWNSPVQNTRVSNLSLLQGIFPIQGSKPRSPAWRILYQLSHKGSPRILEWVAYPFSRGSSRPRDWTWVSLHCRQILYQLSHKGSPRILEWVAYPFSRGSSQPRDRTGVSCIAGWFNMKPSGQIFFSVQQKIAIQIVIRNF